MTLAQESRSSTVKDTHRHGCVITFIPLGGNLTMEQRSLAAIEPARDLFFLSGVPTYCPSSYEKAINGILARIQEADGSIFHLLPLASNGSSLIRSKGRWKMDIRAATPPHGQQHNETSS